MKQALTVTVHVPRRPRRIFPSFCVRGIPLRSITAVAAISLLALASFGTVLVFEIPVTADEALHHAEDVSDPGEVYLWKCPTSDGSSYTLERLELDIPTHDKSDTLRVPTVFVPVPILLVDSEDPCVIQVAEHILSKTEGYSDYLKIAAALYFVQSAIRYTSDQALYGCFSSSFPSIFTF